VQARSIRAALAALLLGCVAALEASAQPSSSVDIPLQLIAVGSQNSFYRLAINVGINGGKPQLYMFDTGSAPFVAAFNPNTWGGFAGQTTVPNSPYANGNNVFYCYGGNCSSASTTGNFIPIRSLSLSGITFTANPGYAVDAVSQLTIGNQTVNFPNYFTNNSQAAPPFSNAFGPFYGVFGAGNFTQGVMGGVLGQTIVSGAAAQGYLVAANGQPNPASSTNWPQQVNGITVSVGGVTQPVTSCSPCVTVGLTPQVIGQFAPVGLPSTIGQVGVVPVRSSNSPYNNPYVPIGSAPGNNSSTQNGANFTVSLVAPGASTPGATVTTGTLLDTGTTNFILARALNQPGVATNGSANAGVTLRATGVTAGGASIPGLPTSTAVLTRGGSPDTYNASFSGSTNILGISFFLQNSVLFDLSDNLIGYTPFFVTDASLATTANGPLIVNGTNIPLGLAGVISGPGGVIVNNGAALQLSATNTYTGPTTIANGGQLYISGAGSIAYSSGVANYGIFDISRAWAPVAIQALSGAGLVSLGGQNLTIANANGTFSGTIADGGAWPAAGGSLTIAGGTQVLSGVNTYTGGTFVSGGTLMLTGSVASGVLVASNGLLSGNGFIGGNVVNSGIVSPGMLAPLSIGSGYWQTAGGTYAVTVNATGQGDKLAISGAANLQGGSVLAALPQAGSYAPRTTYTILTAAGGVTGTYSSVLSSAPFLQPSLSYDANDAYLTLQIGGFGAVAQNPTQYAVGHALDVSAPYATGDYATVLTALAQLSPSLVQTDPDVAVGHELLGLLELHGAGRATVHEQLPGPGQRRQSRPGQGGAGRSLRRRLRHQRARQMGCLGRRPGRARHDRRRPEPGRADLQCRRLRRRARPQAHRHPPGWRDGRLHLGLAMGLGL
jgi:autotransporter-associated beta strand protein